jgi:hypothetical protein
MSKFHGHGRRKPGPAAVAEPRGVSVADRTGAAG